MKYTGVLLRVPNGFRATINGMYRDFFYNILCYGKRYCMWEYQEDMDA